MTHLAETLDNLTLADALDTNAKAFVDALAEAMQEGDDAVFEYEPLKRVQPIEHESRSGFWSWNNGGYQVCLPASLFHAWSSGTCPAPIASTIASGNDLIADEWDRQHPEGPTFNEAICSDDEELHEEACDWEQNGWQSDDDCYYWKARAIFYAPGSPQNESGKPEVYLDAYLCSDSYGRDNISWLSAYGSKTDQTAGKFKLTMAADKFAAITSEQMSKLVANAMRKLPSFVNCA